MPLTTKVRVNNNHKSMKHRNKIYPVFGWLLIIVALISAFLVRYYEEKSAFFLTMLGIELIVAFVFRNRIFGRIALMVSWMLLALLFIFSGYSKAVDPMGTKHLIIDYFIAWDIEWAKPFALILSVFLNTFELVCGILLLLRVKLKIITWLLLLMMLFFSIVTVFNAFYQPIPDCGCFGEAFTLVPWQTFYENLVIDVFMIIFFFNHQKFRSAFSRKIEWIIIVVAIVLAVYFQVYNLRHLPMHDFRAWKVGNKMSSGEKKPLEYYLTYMNKESGEDKEYLSPNYPYNDSVWMSEWEFVSQRVEDPNPKRHNLVILDNNGSDLTSHFVENEDLQFFLVASDLSQVKKNLVPDINEFYEQCGNLGISFIVLTSSTPEQIEEFKERVNPAAFEYYFADHSALEAMIRANPGLVLLMDAVVKEKWHYNDFPVFQEFISEFYSECSMPQ